MYMYQIDICQFLMSRGTKITTNTTLNQLPTILTLSSGTIQVMKKDTLLHIMCGYQCDKAVTKNDTREMINDIISLQ